MIFILYKQANEYIERNKVNLQSQKKSKASFNLPKNLQPLIPTLKQNLHKSPSKKIQSKQYLLEMLH